jgi:hypothetical protein
MTTPAHSHHAGELVGVVARSELGGLRRTIRGLRDDFREARGRIRVLEAEVRQLHREVEYLRSQGRRDGPPGSP